MSEKPKFRMGRGEKAFLLVFGILFFAIPAVAIPALLHQRERSRSVAAGTTADQETTFYTRTLKRLNNSISLHNSINLMCRAYGAPHVSIGKAAQYPDMALVTVVWPTVNAFQILINPDETRPGAVPPMMQQVRLDSIHDSTTNWNCRVDDYGNLTLPPWEKECLPEDATIAPTQPTPPPNGADLNQQHENVSTSQVRPEGPSSPQPASQGQADTLVSPRDVEEILPQPVLIYPSMARIGKVQGTVQVEVTISADGAPFKAISMNGPEMLRKASEEWQMKRRFKPPVIDRKKQAVRVVMTMNYSLKDGAAITEGWRDDSQISQ